MRIKTITIFFILSSFSSFAQGLHNRNSDTLIEWEDLFSYYNKANDKNTSNINYLSYSGTFGYMLLAEFGGEIRQIHKDDQDYFQRLLSPLYGGRDVSGLFKNEVLLNTPIGPIYLPIQESLIGYWKEELKKGDQMAIRIRAYGAIKKTEGIKWLFGINSYGSNEYEFLWQSALDSFNDGRNGNGLNCLYKLMELDPKDGRNYATLGYHYYSEGFPDKASLLLKADSLYEISQRLTPDYAYQYYQRGLEKY